MVSEAHKMVQESEDRAQGLEQLAQDVYKQACVRIQELVNVAEKLYQSNYCNQASSSQLLTEEERLAALIATPSAVYREPEVASSSDDVLIQHVPSEDQRSDIMTKGLAPQKWSSALMLATFARRDSALAFGRRKTELLQRFWEEKEKEAKSKRCQEKRDAKSKRRQMTGNHPRALAHALEDQIHDKDVVCTAVSHDGMVLVFAPEEMRNHEEVVQAAVSQNGLALEYASPRLREKTETVLAALGQNPDAIHHVLPIVRDDHRMMAFGQERRPCLLEMLSERPRPMALKMALARIRMFVEPLLKETKTSWEDARFVLRKMNSLAELQGAVDDPKAFIDSLNKRQDDMGREWVIATLRFRLEPLAAEQDLWWDEMVPVLKSCSRKELLQAQENGKRFLETINNKTRGETAQLLAIAKLRRPFSRVLPVGLPWADVVPALHKVETLKELQNAREAPDLLMWKMSNAQQEWPPAVLYSFLRLRPKMEPKLTELVPGVMWEDFVKSLQVLDPMELHQASQSLYRFLQLLEIYPADPPGRWWFIARLRPHIELALDTQGNTWEEAVEMMFEMDPAFDLKPAIHEPLVFCEQLAEGPQHLRWKTTLRPEELKAELRKAAEDG
ncbi:unnamed protein product [Cladocopium goreaui]|uniref:DUF4116 domain-containing protein n=1 Tax=Cladocopium goreaui TaxID=2562237 RepID=A0A9P1FKG3_9DINO|nr:unnamed protein product [Cladocopium goreaui]